MPPPLNVQLAQQDLPFLTQRYTGALQRCPPGLALQFEVRIRDFGRVGINCKPSGLVGFLDEGLYRNLHQLVGLGRIPPGTDYGVRLMVENRLGYQAIGIDICYGSLNTGNCGCRFFGDYCVVLQQDAIKDRVAFLEKNAFSFFGMDLLGGPIAGQRLPKGCRATWDNVSKLALAKLYPMLAGISSLDVPAMNDAIAGYSETIEAHIFGPIRRQDIEEVRLPSERLVRVMYLRGSKSLSSDDQLFLNTHGMVLERLEHFKIRVVPMG